MKIYSWVSVWNQTKMKFKLHHLLVEQWSWNVVFWPLQSDVLFVLKCWHEPVRLRWHDVTSFYQDSAPTVNTIYMLIIINFSWAALEKISNTSCPFHQNIIRTASHHHLGQWLYLEQHLDYENKVVFVLQASSHALQPTIIFDRG